MNDIPPTEAELALRGDALARWERNMPQPEPPKRKKLDTRQYSVDEQIAAAIEAHTHYMDQVLIGVIAEVEHRANEKLKHLQQKLQQLENQLEVERQIAVRMAQTEPQRHYPRANGHA